MFSSFRERAIDFLRSSPNHAESARPAGTPAAGPSPPLTSPFSALQVRWKIHFFNSFMTLAHKCTEHTSLADAIRRLFVACGWIATRRSTAHPTERDRTVKLVRSVPSWLSGRTLARAPSIAGRHERDLLLARRPTARVPTDDAGQVLGTRGMDRQTGPPANVEAADCCNRCRRSGRRQPGAIQPPVSGST